MTVIADTLQAKKRLLDAGFSDEKAEGIVAIFQSADAQTATKLDLDLFRKDTKAEIATLRKDMKAEIAALRKDTKADIEELRKDTRTEIAALRHGMDSRFAQVDARFESLELRLTHLILKAQFAGVVATVAILSALRFFT